MGRAMMRGDDEGQICGHSIRTTNVSSREGTAVLHSFNPHNECFIQGGDWCLLDTDDVCAYLFLKNVCAYLSLKNVCAYLSLKNVCAYLSLKNVPCPLISANITCPS
jgi:hypothetical protein